MNNIASLNNTYINVCNRISELNKYSGLIKSKQTDNRKSDQEKATSSVKLLIKLSNILGGNSFPIMEDSVRLGGAYLGLNNALKEYKEALLTSPNAVTEKCTALADQMERFAREKDFFLNKYNDPADSPEVICHIVLKSLKESRMIENKKADKLKAEAKMIFENDLGTDLDISDNIREKDVLPELLHAARHMHKVEAPNILKDIGITKIHEYVDIDLRNQGNIVIHSDYKDISDEKIDNFIIAYIFRFIELFPLGSVNVHIFNKNSNYLCQRLNDCFKTENSGESIKKTVQLYSSLDKLSALSDVVCNDIFRKTSSDKPDLYSLYNSDRSDPFNLIILRDGLVDSSGYASAEMLERINILTRITDKGHKCGFRFLIIDNSSSFSRNFNDTTAHLVHSIISNCELRLKYSQGEYAVNEETVDVLNIRNDTDKFIQERSKMITDILGQKEKNYILLEDISANEVAENVGSIMRIPVGKEGDKIVQLPFSCKDDNSTTEGQCIGYMTIGQSGSGKSSFFHSLVLNGCLKYSPKDLRFWLLDFKNGGASSKYSRCGIPHIHIIAENNKIDDAFCLFQMILEEMEKRYNAFNDNFTNDIIEYNKKALENNLEYFPRIIIAIDEIQEIFRDDNASELQKLLSSISTRMRAAGMHFVMVAQNLSEGKSYMLRDALMPSAKGRICFRVAKDIARDSGFEEEFIERENDIMKLKTGEAYLSFGKDTIKKVRMAYVDPKDMNDKYFADILNKHPEYSDSQPLVIGSKKKLTIGEMNRIERRSYFDILANNNSINGINVVIGEDVYRMSPLSIQFTQNNNSSALFLGSDKNIASSLCTSAVISLMRQNVEMHIFNGDRTAIQTDNDPVQHPFMYTCQMIADKNEHIKVHKRLIEFKDVLGNMYNVYLERKAAAQEAESEMPYYAPMFLIVNDLFGIECFTNNEPVGINNNSLSPANEYDHSIFETGIYPPDDNKIQDIMSIIIKDGYRFNIHMILAIKGDTDQWCSFNLSSDINNVILINDTEYADQIGNSYYLKEMLKNISNDIGEETLAVLSRKKKFSKIRPVIYSISDQREKEMLDKLLEGGLA